MIFDCDDHRDDLGGDIDDLTVHCGGGYDFPKQQINTFDHRDLLILQEF